MAAPGSAAAALRASLLPLAARFASDGLPLTGVVGAPGLHLLLDAAPALAAALGGGAATSSPGGGASGGLDGAWHASARCGVWFTRSAPPPAARAH